MATTHRIITATSNRDFLSHVPALLGFTPQRSLVIIPFEGHRSIGGMRFDLDAPGLADTALGLACRIRTATHIAAVIYTDDDADTTTALAAEIAASADRIGLHLIDSLYVARDGWGSHQDDDQAPRPVKEIATPDPLAAHVAASQSAEATIPDADPARAEAIAAQLELLDGNDLRLFATTLESALDEDPAELDALSAAVLLDGIGSALLRDVALIQWATDADNGTHALAAQVAAAVGIPVPEQVACTLFGQGPRPDAHRLTAGLAHVRHLTAYGDDAQRAHLLSAAAWLSWALGRSTHAGVYADKALAIDPEHGMAQIVATIISAGHLPEWALER